MPVEPENRVRPRGVPRDKSLVDARIAHNVFDVRVVARITYWLTFESMWFEVMPMPDGEWAISTRDEGTATRTFDRIHSRARMEVFG